MNPRPADYKSAALPLSYTSSGAHDKIIVALCQPGLGNGVRVNNPKAALAKIHIEHAEDKRFQNILEKSVSGVRTPCSLAIFSAG